MGVSLQVRRAAQKLTIGAFPAIDLKAARELASDAAKAIARGDDPAAAKQAAKITMREATHETRDLVEKVVETFIERYAKEHTRSWRETERMLNKEIVGRGKGPPFNVGKADVHDLLDKIIDRGAPISANRILAALRRMCSWAVERDIIKVSPCDGVKAPSAAVSRDRVLSDDELRIAWGAFEKTGWPFGPLARLLVLTGARLREVAEMRWSESTPPLKPGRFPKIAQRMALRTKSRCLTPRCKSSKACHVLTATRARWASFSRQRGEPRFRVLSRERAIGRGDSRRHARRQDHRARTLDAP